MRNIVVEESDTVVRLSIITENLEELRALIRWYGRGSDVTDFNTYQKLAHAKDNQTRRAQIAQIERAKIAAKVETENEW